MLLPSKESYFYYIFEHFYLESQLKRLQITTLFYVWISKNSLCDDKSGYFL